jgi:hypothetical protein
MSIGKVRLQNVAMFECDFGGTMRPATPYWAVPSIEEFISVELEVCNTFCVVLEGECGSAKWPRATNGTRLRHQRHAGRKGDRFFRCWSRRGNVVHVLIVETREQPPERAPR